MRKALATVTRETAEEQKKINALVCHVTVMWQSCDVLHYIGD